MEDEPDYHEYYADKVGKILIVMGVLGMIMNSLALVYFFRLKTSMTNAIYSKMAFINLATVDLLLSLCVACLRGPGFLWPKQVWGTNTNGTSNEWCKAGFYITWIISDMNLLGVVPLSLLFFFLYAPCIALSRFNMIVTIVICWLTPIVECVVIFIGTQTGNLELFYLDSYRRCVHSGNWLHFIDTMDSTLFFGIPTALHLMAWSSIIYFVCRQGNTVYDKQWMKFMKTGVIVIVSFTFTWLPYWIVVNYHHSQPSERTMFIFCFLFSSILINPVIYALRSIKFQGTYVSRVLREVVEENCECCLTCLGLGWCCRKKEDISVKALVNVNNSPPSRTSVEDLSDGEDMVSHQ